MTAKPLVTVLMPVYNAEKFVEQAVRSILGQSFTAYELLVIDDGSADRTPHVLNRYAGEKVRIQRLEGNLGIASALNRGLALARGQYIARMDADDIAFPERLEKQVEFLESHPDVGIVGSAVRVIGESGRRWGVQPVAPSDIGIRWTCLLQNPFLHPSVMFRRRLLDEHELGYRPLPFAEDYDLWVRMLDVTKGANIERPLLFYRIHGTSVSRLRRRAQSESHYAVSRDAIRRELPRFQIEDSQIKDIVALLFADAGELSRMRRERATGALSYLSMWRAFCREHEPAATELDPLRRSVIGRAVGWALFPPVSRGVGDVLRLAGRIDRRWPLHFLAALPGHMSGFMRKRLSRAI